MDIRNLSSRISQSFLDGGGIPLTLLVTYMIFNGDAFNFKKSENAQKLEMMKSEVIRNVDKDNNGLSFQECYKIEELMGIQNRPSTYVPTFKDWEKAYYQSCKER